MKKSNITVEPITGSSTVMMTALDPESRLQPSRYSKWYRIIQPGKCEFGLSIVHVRGWVNQFIHNSRMAQENRETGELKPKELDSKEQIIKQIQEIVFPKEMAALKKGKPVLKSSSVKVESDSQERSNKIQY